MFINQQAGGILSPLVDAVRIAPYIPVEPVVHDLVMATSVKTNTNPGIKLNSVVIKGSVDVAALLSAVSALVSAVSAAACAASAAVCAVSAFVSAVSALVSAVSAAA